MKHWALRIVTSVNIKSGIAFAYQVCILVANALQGVLAGDGLSDERRKQIASTLHGVVAVRDFLGRLVEIMGIRIQASAKGFEPIIDKADELDRITDSL